MALKPYEKAGRIFRLLAFLKILAVAGIWISIALPTFSKEPGLTLEKGLVLTAIALAGFGICYFFFSLSRAITQHKEWGKKAGIVLGFLMLLAFPIGTILGIYILWCLTKGWNSPATN